MPIPTAEGFEGFPATWFYLDRKAGTLSETAPAAEFATGDTVSVTITPRFFNAPRRAAGANDKTQFLAQGKPAAYLKAQLDQDRAGTSTKPLTYAAMYPLVNRPNDDIGSTFFTDPGPDGPVQNVPLPGGSGKFRTPITAIVGGTKPKSSLFTIINQVMGLANVPAAKMLFPIPAADLALASTVESLINSAATAFAPETEQQYWINDAPIDVAANQASARNADSDVLQLMGGTTVFAVFPTGDGGQIESTVRTIASQPGLTFNIDRGGALTATKGAALVSPNPFANLIYVTYQATVRESS